MSVSPISSHQQSAAPTQSESHEVKGAPDHDGDADDQKGASAAGGAQGPSFNVQGQPVGLHVNAKA